MKHGYACDNCNGFTGLRDWIFACLWCGKEICGSCLFSYATCKECAAVRTEAELLKRFDEEYPDEDAESPVIACATAVFGSEP